MREKFTTNLDPEVLKKLRILTAQNEERAVNRMIERLVNEKWEENKNESTNS